MWRTIKSAIQSWDTTIRLIVAVFGLTAISCGSAAFSLYVLHL
jgi:hypothetical protein